MRTNNRLMNLSVALVCGGLIILALKGFSDRQRETMAHSLGIAIAHTNLPPDCELKCDDAGHYLIVIGGKYTFQNNPIYTNKQAAIERAWRGHDKVPDPAPADFQWKTCDE